MIASFAFFLLLFLIVGLISARYSRGTRSDYYLASCSIKPWMVGLSAIATNNSGYMFIGMIGFAYTIGLPAAWVGAGLVFGDFLTSLVVHKRLRRKAEATGEVSYAGVLSAWHGTEYVWMRRLIGLVSLVFLLAYASAQFSAGSKMLQVVGDIPAYTGAVIGFVLVTVYCLVGGARASVWTDVLQSVVMVAAMVIVFLAVLFALGGIGGALPRMAEIPGFLAWQPQAAGLMGVSFFALGWVFAGFCVVGQPHIMSRIMMLDDAEHYRRVRPWYYSWYIGMYTMATSIGMLARVYLPESSGFDAELALPTVTLQLLPSVMVGLVIAGVFSATLSTADSQILSCSATLARDLVPDHRSRRWKRPLMIKVATLICASLAFVMALSSNPNIFNLVLLAWGAMGAALGPLAIVYAFGGRPTQATGIAMILVGLAVAIGWRMTGMNSIVYEGLPAISAGFITYLLSAMLGGVNAAPHEPRFTAPERPA